MTQAMTNSIATDVFAPVEGLFARLRKSYGDNRRYRLTAAELRRLDDRELNDLGLSRGDIDRIALDSVYPK